MNRFDDITIESENDSWIVSAWDNEKEDTVSLRVGYWDLVSFAQEYYGMDRYEAIGHIGVCPEEEEDKLLKLLFVKKMT